MAGLSVILRSYDGIDGNDGFPARSIPAADLHIRFDDFKLRWSMTESNQSIVQNHMEVFIIFLLVFICFDFFYILDRSETTIEMNLSQISKLYNLSLAFCLTIIVYPIPFLLNLKYVGRNRSSCFCNIYTKTKLAVQLLLTVWHRELYYYSTFAKSRYECFWTRTRWDSCSRR